MVCKEAKKEARKLSVQVMELKVQSTKILLLPPKYEIILLPFKDGNFSNIGIAIFDFSLLVPI